MRMFWPLCKLTDAWVLRRLMRQMPTTPQLWVPTTRGIRPETDAEYLSRLRERAQERAARASATKRGARLGQGRRSPDRALILPE